MGRLADQAKRKKKRAKGNQSRTTYGPQSVNLPPGQSPTPGEVPSPSIPLVTASDIETTLSTLEVLAELPTEVARKDLKDVKRAVYAFQKVMTNGMTIDASLTSKISTALQDYRFTDALILLFEMHVRNLPPKLGSLQRWVRDCDATISADGTIRNVYAMRCLDLILRIASPSSVAGPSQHPDSPGNLLTRKLVWRAREALDGEIAIWERIKGNTLFDVPPLSPYPNFRVVQYTPGHLRKPPNKYGSTVYASSPNAIRLTPTDERPRKASRMDVPGLPGCFMVLDVFTPEECLQIAQAASAIGFEKDEAAGGSASDQASILARNFVWLADTPFLEHFYRQILEFVPQQAPQTINGNGGGAVRGINARFRVYEYKADQVYRPHIDGAWPAAGLDKVSGEYLHDSSPPSDPLWSRYTLLVYLNSDIPGDTGCTTFFLPSIELGVMETTSVRPIQGAVLCFPHGDAEGSLLHEGSAVGPNGGKLVIRTDLLFEAKGFGQYRPKASVALNGEEKMESYDR